MAAHLPNRNAAPPLHGANYMLAYANETGRAGSPPPHDAYLSRPPPSHARRHGGLMPRPRSAGGTRRPPRTARGTDDRPVAPRAMATIDDCLGRVRTREVGTCACTCACDLYLLCLLCLLPVPVRVPPVVRRAAADPSPPPTSNCPNCPRASANAANGANRRQRRQRRLSHPHHPPLHVHVQHGHVRSARLLSARPSARAESDV